MCSYRDPTPMSRLAQFVERKTLELVVLGSSPTVGVFEFILPHTFDMFFCLLLFFVFYLCVRDRSWDL